MTIVQLRNAGRQDPPEQNANRDPQRNRDMEDETERSTTREAGGREDEEE